MSPSCDDIDLASVYSEFCDTVAYKTGLRDEFFIDVFVQDVVLLQGMLDIKSMACTMSTQALCKLLDAKVLTPDDVSPTLLTLIGCGGLKTSPLGVYDLQMKVFDWCFAVPALIVDGQSADLILGSNLIKHLIQYQYQVTSGGEYQVRKAVILVQEL